jgi:hypothetical protein
MNNSRPGQPSLTNTRTPLLKAVQPRAIALKDDRQRACYSSGISSEDKPMSSNPVNPGVRTSPAIPHPMVTTAFTLDGYAIVRNLGLVRGIIVRSRSIVGTIGATLQTMSAAT